MGTFGGRGNNDSKESLSNLEASCAGILKAELTGVLWCNTCIYLSNSIIVAPSKPLLLWGNKCSQLGIISSTHSVTSLVDLRHSPPVLLSSLGFYISLKSSYIPSVPLHQLHRKLCLSALASSLNVHLCVSCLKTVPLCVSFLAISASLCQLPR